MRRLLAFLLAAGIRWFRAAIGSRASQGDRLLRRVRDLDPLHGAREIVQLDVGIVPDRQRRVGMARQQLRFLHTGARTHDAGNALLIGQSGLGKSHLAQAIGLRACRAGYSVQHISTNQMFTQLRAARVDGSYEKKLLRFTSVELLIVDDLGLRPLERDEPIDLYEIIRQR